MTRPDAPLVCIGGHSDGKRVACRDTAMFQAPLPDSVRMFTAPPEIPLTVDVYHREALHVQDVQFYFWRHENLTTPDAIARLLEGYKRP